MCVVDLLIHSQTSMVQLWWFSYPTLYQTCNYLSMLRLNSRWEIGVSQVRSASHVRSPRVIMSLPYKMISIRKFHVKAAQQPNGPFGWCQSVLTDESWPMVRCAAHSSGWPINVSQVSGPRFTAGIKDMNLFAHLPCCQCTEACSYVSFIQNNVHADKLIHVSKRGPRLCIYMRHCTMSLLDRSE